MKGVGELLAYLLTIRTYGTWLHSDARGSVDREHNVFGTPFLEPDRDRMYRSAKAMRFAPMIFDEAMRRVVGESVLEMCGFHQWPVLERAVRTNHVHIVVGHMGLEPERVLQRLKAQATRALRERGLVAAGRPVWADGAGSRRYLWTEADVAGAAVYVREYQDTPR